MKKYNMQRTKVLETDPIKVKRLKEIMANNPSGSRLYKRSYERLRYWTDDKARAERMESGKKVYSKKKEELKALRKIIDENPSWSPEYKRAYNKWKYHMDPKYRELRKEQNRIRISRKRREALTKKVIDKGEDEKKLFEYIFGELMDIIRLSSGSESVRVNDDGF